MDRTTNRQDNAWYVATVLVCASIGVYFVSEAISPIRINLADADVDGFMSQLSYMHSTPFGGRFDPLSLYNMHMLRYILFWPFVQIKTIPDYFVYFLFISPLCFDLGKERQWTLVIMLLVYPVFVSVRSAFAGSGLLMIAYASTQNRRAIFLVLGLMFVSLSTASILQSFLILLVFRIRNRRGYLELPIMTILAYFLFISLFDKAVGAIELKGGYVGEGNAGGLSGSASTVPGSLPNIFLQIMGNYLSRSTLIVAFREGEFRAQFYAAVHVWYGALLIFFFIRKRADYVADRLLMLAVLPGFLAEGLGVLASIPLLLWRTLRQISLWFAARNAQANKGHDVIGDG